MQSAASGVHQKLRTRSTWAVLLAKSRVGRAFPVRSASQTPWEPAWEKSAGPFRHLLCLLGGTICPVEFSLLPLSCTIMSGAGGSLTLPVTGRAQAVHTQMKAVSAEYLGLYWTLQEHHKSWPPSWRSGRREALGPRPLLPRQGLAGTSACPPRGALCRGIPGGGRRKLGASWEVGSGLTGPCVPAPDSLVVRGASPLTRRKSTDRGWPVR